MSTAETEARLLDATATIRRCWDALLEPTASAQVGSASTDEVTALDKRISLRHEVTLALNGWARVVMEDRPVTRALPAGTDTLGLLDFLDRHAQWFSGHEAAEDAAAELAEWASKVRAVAEPKRKERTAIGDCPFVLDWQGDLDLRVDSTDSPVMCHGRVWATVGPESMGECDECGTYGVVEWWEEVLDVLPDHGVTPERMARILHARMGVSVTDRTLRNWTRDGRIERWEPFGPQLENPPLRLLPKAVLDAVARMHRQCPYCGREWSGVGDVCTRCLWAMRAEPVMAEPKPAFAVVYVPRKPAPEVVQDPADDERPGRCHWSDLFEDQCACGRHARQPA